jgi:hypothetical protein
MLMKTAAGVIASAFSACAAMRRFGQKNRHELSKD